MVSQNIGIDLSEGEDGSETAEDHRRGSSVLPAEADTWKAFSHSL